MAKKQTFQEKKSASATGHVSVRMDPALRDTVVRWSNENDVTISRAVETLLRTSLQRREATNRELLKIFGGSENLNLAIGVATVIRYTQIATTARWADDEKAADAAFSAVVAFLRSAMQVSDAVDLEAANCEAESSDPFKGIQEAPANFGYSMSKFKFNEWLKSRKVLPWNYGEHSDEENSPVNETQAADWLAHRIRHSIDNHEPDSDSAATEQVPCPYHPSLLERLLQADEIALQQRQRILEVWDDLVAEGVEEASKKECANRMQ